VLKGSALETFIADNRAKGVTLAREIAPAAGYVKPNGKVAYMAFYMETIRIKVRRDAINNPAKGCVNTLIKAIHDKKNYHYRNDTVYVANESRNVYVYHRDQLICIIFPDKVRLLEGNKTKAIKERLNRILMHLCGVKLFQKQGEWFISQAGLEDVTYNNSVPILE